MQSAFRKGTYTKRPGTSGIQGQLYEIKLLMLFAGRALASNATFQLGSNVNEAGSFDDVVASYKIKGANGVEKTKTICVQAKHVVGKYIKIITANNLVDPEDLKFNVAKYYDSYVKTGNIQFFNVPVRDVQFIIYTNIDVDKTIFVEVLDPNCDELIRSNGKIYKLKDNKIKNLVTYVETNTGHKNKNKIRQFLKNLKFYVNQSNEEDLDSYIKKNITRLTNHAEELKKDEIDQIFLNAQDIFKQWWQKVGEIKFLTEKVNFFQDAFKKLPKITASMKCFSKWKEEITGLNISYKDPCIQDLLSKIKSGQFTNVISKQNAKIFTVAKVLQVLKSENKNFVMMDDKFGNCCPEIFSDFEKHDNEFLVFVGEDIRFLTQLTSILTNKHKKLIIISETQCQFTDETKLIEDIFNIEDLDENFINSLLKTKINLQGNENIVLKDLMNDKTCFDIDIVKLLISKENLCIESNFTKLCDNYVPRTILKYNCVHNNILSDDLSSDQIIIINSDKKFQSFNDTIIIAVNQKHAETSYNNLHGNVHMLVSNNGTLKWMKSKGSNSLLRKHIIFNDTSREIFSEEKFISDIKNTKVVLISDTAGMGKTTLLRSIVRKIKEKDPKMWLIKLDLKNNIEISNTNVTNEQAINDLSNYISFNSKLEERMFNYCLKYKNNIIFVVDGVDEIISSREVQEDEVYRFLTSITRTKCSKMIITCRKSKQYILEEKLNTLCYNIKPLAESEQIEYLLKSWQVGTGNIEDLAEKIIDRLNSNEGCKNDNGICSNPLQLHMVSQIYKPQIEALSDDESENEIDETVFGLYKDFVKFKLKLFLQNKLEIKTNNLHLKNAMMFMKPSFMNIHTYLALKLFFNEVDINAIFQGHKIAHVEKMIENVSTFGIVEYVRGENIKFIHQTYAEYFIADYILYNLSQITDKNFHNFFLLEILTVNNFNVIRKLLNENLEKFVPKNSEELATLYRNLNFHETPLHMAAMENNYNIVKFIINLFSTAEDTENIFNAQNKKLKTALHLASSAGNVRIVEALIESGAKLDIRDIGEDTALTLACHSNRLTVVNVLVNNGADVNTLSKNGLTPLHIASKYGYIEIFKTLVDSGADLQFKTSNGINAYHTAIKFEKWDIVKLLVDSYNFDINSKLIFGEKLLFEAAKRNAWNIVEWMHESNRITNINELNINNETVLDIAAQALNWDMVNYLVSIGFICKDVTNILLLAISNGELNILKFMHEKSAISGLNYNKSLVIHKAVECKNLEILKWLVEKAGVDVHLKTENGNTILHIVDKSTPKDFIKYVINTFENINIRGFNGETILQNMTKLGDMELIQMLIKREANINERDDSGNTVLHVAARSGNIELVTYFSTLGLNLEDKNDKFETLLHCATKSKNLELVRYLIDNGIAVNARNKDSVVALLYPIKNWDIAHLLLDRGANIDEIDYEGNHILHFAARTGQENTVNKIIQRYSDVKERKKALNLKNNKGISILARAIRSKKFKLVEMLVNQGANVCALDNDGNSLLHYASTTGNLEIIKFLIEKQLEITHKNNNEESVLHTAIMNGKIDAAKYFYETKSLSLYDTDKNGNNVLHLAAKYGKVPILQWILEGDVNLTIKNKENETACEIAARFGKIQVLQILIQKTERCWLESHVMVMLRISTLSGQLDILKWLLLKFNTKYYIDEKELMALARFAEQPHIVKWLERTFVQ